MALGFGRTQPGGVLMKRVTLEEAFGDSAAMQAAQYGDLQGEAVVLSVRGGEVIAVVPEGTADDGVLAAASSLRAAVRLENERVLMFEIHEGGSSASFRDEAARLHTAVQVVEASRGGGAVDVAALGTVDQVMTRGVMTATPDELVEDVAKRLAFHNVTGLPVEDWDGTIVGIVSEMDVIGRIGEVIRDVMTANVVSVPPDTTVERAARLMAERGIKRLPVLADGKLVGIISRADVVRLLAERSQGAG
jgi:CBS domain-containing protein